jgi:hypothetical protein
MKMWMFHDMDAKGRN